MDKNKEERFNRIKDAWQPFYKEELSLNDAKEIAQNLYNVANLLKKLKDGDKQGPNG